VSRCEVDISLGVKPIETASSISPRITSFAIRPTSNIGRIDTTTSKVSDRQISANTLNVGTWMFTQTVTHITAKEYETALKGLF
jgi:hypothetical protein